MLSEIVDLLDNDGELGPLDNHPWPVYDAEQGELHEVDWRRVFNRESDGWIDDTELDQEIRGAIGTGPRSLTRRDDATGSPAPDLCAWYQPIHFHGMDFGIYITNRCIQETAVDIARFLPNSASSYPRVSASVLRFALSVIYLHEAYHHKTESLALRYRIVEQRPRYRAYQTQVYMPSVKSTTAGPLEEALANADSYRRFGDRAYRQAAPLQMVRAVRDYLEDSFRIAPHGYRNAHLYLSDDDFSIGENVHKSNVQEGASIPARQPDEWRIAPGITRGLFSVTSEFWEVVPHGRRPLLPVFPLYRPVSTRKLVQALRTVLGYQQVKGGKGSHIKLRSPGRPRLILPANRKDISPPVLRNIAKDLGFTDGGSMLTHLGI